MKFKAYAFFTLFISISFFGSALLFSLISPPVYGQTADAWNIHRQGVGNDLNFYYGLSGLPALQLNTNGNAQVRALFDIDNTSKVIDPSATSSLKILNVSDNINIGTSTGLQLLTAGTSAGNAIHLGTTDPATGTWIRSNGGDVVFSSKVGGDMYYGYNGPASLDHRFGTDAGNPTLFVQGVAGGNVGVGTTAPTAKLDVDGNITQTVAHGNNMKLLLPASRNFGGTGQAGLYSWISEPGMTWTGGGIARNMYNQTGFPRVNTGLSGQMLHFAESGMVEFVLETAAGVRKTPLTIHHNGLSVDGLKNSALTIYNSDVSRGVSLGADGASGAGNAYLNTTSSGYALLFGIDNAEKMRISTTGNVGIGTSTPAHRLHVAGTPGTTTGAVRIDGILALNGYAPNGCSPSGVWGLCVGGSSGGQSVWNNTSDARLKKNIITIPNALDKVMALRGVYFDFKDLDGVYKTLPKNHQIGFIAQEVEPILPEVVSTGNDGMKMMGYGSITALLTEAIKEQQEQLETERARNDKQQLEIEQLKSELRQLKNN